MTNPYRAPTQDSFRQDIEPDYVRWTKVRLITSGAIAAGLSAFLVHVGQKIEDRAIESILSTQQSIQWNSIPGWLLTIHLGKFSLVAGTVTLLFSCTTKRSEPARTVAATALAMGLATLVLLGIQRIPATWNMNWIGSAAAIATYVLGMLSLAAIACRLRFVPLRPSRIVSTTLLGFAAFAVTIVFVIGGKVFLNDDEFRRESVTFMWSLTTVAQLTILLRCPNDDSVETTSAAVLSASPTRSE